MILVCLNYVIAKNKPTAGFLLRPLEGRFSLSLILSHQNTFDRGEEPHSERRLILFQDLAYRSI